ncbi:MAG: hypothetical protein A4E57_03319 [Syntrophorhabdaceae bacterium PtaU1.Bin034]|jgi:L-rhamnose mutarotase|nr:MAG: hypothetical protein A4E57_03319 [Syntrophorhabdaceae bacterium PtaU1.Bin034]
MAVVNYCFIDEAGDLGGQSRAFLLGCIITDTPDDLLKDMECLEKEVRSSAYYRRHKEGFLKSGFHACKNHPDIYSRFVALLTTMNFRAYAVLLNKHTEYFQGVANSQSKEQIYDYLIKDLLKDRLLGQAEDVNHLFFEQNLSRPSQRGIELRERRLSSVLESISNELLERKLTRTRMSFQVSVLSKKEQKLFSVVDYVNHIILKVHEGRNGNVEEFMKHNYRLIEPKIGSIHDIARGTFIVPRKKRLEIESSFIG